jgi:hypothetical protein
LVLWWLGIRVSCHSPHMIPERHLGISEQHQTVDMVEGYGQC